MFYFKFNILIYKINNELTPWINYKIIKIKIKKKGGESNPRLYIFYENSKLLPTDHHISTNATQIRGLAHLISTFQWSCSPKSISFLKLKFSKSDLIYQFLRKNNVTFLRFSWNTYQAGWKRNFQNWFAFSSDTSFNRILRFSLE